MEGEARRALPGLYKKYGITDEGKGPPKPKKTKRWTQTWIKGFLDRFKRKKKEKRMTLPTGVRTPEQIRELRDIMGLPKKKKPTTITGVRG